jgi:hypothetical protein
MNHFLVAALRTHGVDVLTALEASLISEPDERHLEFTTSQGRTLFSQNIGDFYRLHCELLKSGKSHAGIILCKQRQFPVGEQMRRIVKPMFALSANDMVDRIEFLGAWGRA